MFNNCDIISGKKYKKCRKIIILFYLGPELEMWTMGFLLYVLMFNENPFYDVEETLTCQFNPPFAVTPLCFEIIKNLLSKDPQIRMKLDQLKTHPWVNQLVCIGDYKFSEIVPCSKY